MLARYRNGLTLIPRGVDFDQVFEFVVINIVCGAKIGQCEPLRLAEEGAWTYKEPIAAPTVPGRSGRTSFLELIDRDCCLGVFVSQAVSAAGEKVGPGT